MNESNNFKSKITNETKTIVGVIGIILGFLFWGIGHPGIGIGDVLILIFPAILLIIPSETIKNSKILGVISIIILLLLLIVGISSLSVIVTEYLPDTWAFRPGYVESMLLSSILQLILCIYGLFCAILLTIKTSSKNNDLPSNNNTTNKTYTRYCSKCGEGLQDGSNFCHKCGAKFDNESE